MSEVAKPGFFAYHQQPMVSTGPTLTGFGLQIGRRSHWPSQARMTSMSFLPTIEQVREVLLHHIDLNSIIGRTNIGLCPDPAGPTNNYRTIYTAAKDLRPVEINLDKLIYLDLDFISRKFEELTNEDPAAKKTTAESANAGLRAVFANAGISVTESISYSITSRSMLARIWNDLNQRYKEFESFGNYQGTKVLWIGGTLTISEWGGRDSKEPGFEFFELKSRTNERMAFLADERYFAAGFSRDRKSVV